MAERAVIYARVSSDKQRENYSIPGQLAEATEYIKKRGYTLVGDRYADLETGHDATGPGVGIVAAYVDDYTSTELSRPGMNAVFHYLESDGFDVLVVHVLDRLARDPYYREGYEREFEQRGARVEYVRGEYSDTPEGEVRKDLDATFAKWENLARVRRTSDGKRTKAQRGLFVIGTAPMGYTIDETSMGGLAVDPAQADVVREIFNLYAHNNLSLMGVAAKLNTQGIKPPYSDRKWSKPGMGQTWTPSAVANILENTAYSGTVYYNKKRRVTRTAPCTVIQMNTSRFRLHRS